MSTTYTGGNKLIKVAQMSYGRGYLAKILIYVAPDIPVTITSLSVLQEFGRVVVHSVNINLDLTLTITLKLHFEDGSSVFFCIGYRLK